MATGIVVGLSRHRDRWSSINPRPDDIRSSTAFIGGSSPIMNPSGHHRSYSDAPDGLSRMRLPPISNLIESAGRPDLSYPSSYHAPQVRPQFQPSLPQSRPTPTSPDSSAWSPINDARLIYQPDQAQRPQYDHRPVAEQYYTANDYHRRASVAVPHLTSTEARHNSSHVLPQPTSDPLSPGSSTTSKTVVREDIIPGKGLCYVYADGSICQKVINGDTVNPKWGTTKAGKPRKRLGQACNTCREKKIKCDPSYPKCTQCQKFGRECRFEAPSRIANKSPKLRCEDSPPAMQMAEDAVRTRRASVALTEASSHSESGTISSRAAGTIDENLSPLTNDSNFPSDTPGPAKKARLNHVEPELLSAPRLPSISHDQHHSFALEVDPFKVNRKLAEKYLDAYLTHVNRSTFYLVPEHLFLDWAQNCEEKSQVSKLVLYCMLALGCSFSKGPEKYTHGRVFASIALEGVMQSFGYSSIQLIQARLIFGLYEFQHGRDERAWDLCGQAMRTACAMDLNTEEGIEQQLRENNMVYGMGSSMLAECMRRTFWTAYTMDSLGVACLCITGSFSRTDCYLRLPCSRRAYDSGHITRTPIFDGEIQPMRVDEALEQSDVGTLGYLMQLASLCCDVRALAFRANRRVSHGRHKRYTAGRDELESQLRQWNENYTAQIKRKYAAKSGMRAEYPFTFGGLHLIYHYACMQLHRHVPHAQLSRGQISEHAQLAYHHAERALAITEILISRKSQDICDYHFAISSPLSGYAIHYAIDILSAAGINTKVLENQSPVLGLIMNSVQLIDSLADVWASAKTQQRQVSDRVRFVMTSARAGIAEGKIGFCMEEPMVTSLDKDEDIVYGVDRMPYLKSFDWAEQIQSPTDLTVVSRKGKRGSYSMWKD